MPTVPANRRPPYRQTIIDIDPWPAIGRRIIAKFSPFFSSVLGAFTGTYAKELLERTRLKGEELQTRWLPLLTAAEELQEKLHALALVYANPGSGTWNEERWNDRPL